MEINSKITVAGSTEDNGIVLLIDKIDINNEAAKCVSVKSDGTIKEFETIQNPISFNAFNQVTKLQEDNIIALLNRKLTDSSIESINSFLTHE